MCEVNGMTSELTGTAKGHGHPAFDQRLRLYLHLYGQGAGRQPGGKYRSRRRDRNVQRQTRQRV